MGDVPRSDIYDDVYFSADGGPAETQHVFLQGNDLPARWQGQARHTIGETGFGTGLNFLLAWKLFEETAAPGAFLDFVSVEKHPLSREQIQAALGDYGLTPYLDKMLAQYPLRVPGFHRMIFDNRVALTLIFDDANEALKQITGQVDSWFLDGFTPAKNPGMWTQTVFAEMARLSHNQTTFSTFTAAGFVKRGLHESGFEVKKRPGFGAKRDMLAGHFTAGKRHAASSCKKIAIVGAGLAGTACAHVLQKYGFEPALYDQNGIASGASGNELGLVSPRLSALRDPAADFYMSAYAQALNQFRQFSDIELFSTGALHLVVDDDKRKRFEQTMLNWQWHEDHMLWLDTGEASVVAGITLQHEAIYLPDSATISPRKLCHALAREIPFHQQAITRVDDIEADIVILANGGSAARFADLPIHTVRGQITQIAATPVSAGLKANLHYGGYLSAAHKGRHYVGSTFQRWIDHTEISAEDNDYNLANLQEAVPALTGDYRITGARAALRCSSKDRFPVIGRIDDNLYVSAAHGSHGILSALMGAHLIADQLRDGTGCLSHVTQATLSPVRFSKI